MVDGAVAVADGVVGAGCDGGGKIVFGMADGVVKAETAGKEGCHG